MIGRVLAIVALAAAIAACSPDGVPTGSPFTKPLSPSVDTLPTEPAVVP